MYGSTGRSMSEDIDKPSAGANQRDNFMSDTLVKHLFFSKILPLLPVESSLRSYQEVEQEEFFLSCRSVAFNVAISIDVNPVIENSLDLVDFLIQNEEITSPNLSDDTMHSVLTIMRLLSDCLEYFWSYCEKKKNTEFQPTYDKQRKNIRIAIVGFATHRPCLHRVPPSPIDPPLATRILNICSKIKFNTRTFSILNGMSHNLSGPSLLPKTSILPKYQKFLRDRDFPSYAEKIDTTIDYILKFVSASNPDATDTFIKIRIVTPLLVNHSITEVGILHYVGIFGCFFLTKKNLASFLELVNKISKSMKRTSCHSLLLYFASKSFLLWIVSRPKEYIQLYQNLLHINNENTDHSIRKIPQLVNELFDHIYSTFNIASVLVATLETSGDQNPNSNNFFNFDTHVHEQNLPKVPVHKTTSRSSSHSSSLNQNGITQDETKNNLTPISTNISSMQSAPHVALSATHAEPMSAISQGPFSIYEETSLYDTAKGDDSDRNEYYDVLTTERELKSSSHSLENVLELYTNYCDIEILSHNSVLRFLIMLLFLDTETFVDINSTSFRHLPELTELKEFTVHPPSNTNTSTSTLNTPGTSRPSSSGDISPSGNEERTQGIKQFTHNLKKLTSLSATSKKSRQSRFLSLLIRNINGSHVSCDVSLIDSLRSIVSILTLCSAVSTYNQNLPCVSFSKRLYKLLGQNLNIGKDWNTINNPYLIHSLDRNLKAKRRIQLEYFASALIIDHKVFLNHLDLDSELKTLNLEKLSIYTEGFRIFFHLLDKHDLTKTIANTVSSFFKTLFYSMADTLLKEFPYFDDTVTDIVSSILDGTILEKFAKTRTLSNINMDPSDLVEGTPTPEPEPSPSSTSSTKKSVVSCSRKNNVVSWDLGSILPTVTGLENPSEFNLNAMEGDTPSKRNAEIPNLISPSAQHSSLADIQNKKCISSSSPLDSEKIILSPHSSGRSSATPNTPTSHRLSFNSPGVKSTISKTLKSPKQQAHGSSRRSSDERLSKFISMTRNNIKQQIQESSNPHESAIEQEQELTENDHARTIMMTIFSIFKRLTNYFILPSEDSNTSTLVSKDFRDIIKPIFVGIMDRNDVLQNSAQSFMDVLINYIDESSEGANEEKLNELYLLSSYAITLFSATLFDLKTSNSKREVLLGIIEKFLKVRSQLESTALHSSKLDGLVKIETSVFPILSMTLGGGLFISLFCNHGNVPSLLKAGYGDFNEAIEFYKKYVGTIDETYLSNTAFIKIMSTDAYSASGSVAFQRRLKNNILRYITSQDSILLDAMNVLYKKWYSYMKVRFLNQQELVDFRNISGIIAALSGIFLIDNNRAFKGFKDFPHLHLLQKEIVRKIDFFIKHQCESLNCSELLTRENSRDLLSVELHPLSFGLLFDNLRYKIDELRFIDLSLPNQESSYILMEQIIIILRTILRRDDEEHILVWFSPRLIESIDDIIEIIERIDNKSIRYYKGIIQMSKMFKALEHSEVSLCIKNHYEIKNRWIKLVISWFETTLTNEYDFENLSKSHREMDLQKRDLDFLFIDTSIESSRALSYLTRDVPLEIPSSGTKDEANRSAAVVFGNYFTILLKGLEQSTNSDLYPVALKHKISLLNENLIVSLTNLSNANVDASFQFTLPMGYSKNKNIKIAFLKVFIDIANNYPFQEINSENTKIEAMKKVISIFIKYPYLAFNASLICSSSDIDAYAAGILNAFETRNAGHIVVCELITGEIKQASKYLDVLRRNSCATRALSLYAKQKGNDYLTKTLRPVLEELLSAQEYFDIERSHSEKEIQRSVKLFLKYLEKLVESITSSLPYFPKELKLIIQTIYKEMQRKFPNYSHIAASSFVFLRFLSPALVSPDSENIIISLDPESKRSFITLAKVIQNMANGSDSSDKWPILRPHSSFLQECSDRIFNFILALCKEDSTIVIRVSNASSSTFFDYHYLHRFFYQNAIQIRASAVNNCQSTEEFESVKEAAICLDNFFGVMGLPEMELSNDLPSFVKENMEKYPQLYEFMNRHAFKNIQTEGQIDNSLPVNESMSATGLPILIITCSNLESKYDDIELAVYKLLQIYARIWSNKHYVVINSTGFNISENLFKAFCRIVFNLLPDVCVQNCIKLYYINTTEAFMRCWIALRTKGNPFLEVETPFEFLNTSTDQGTIKALGLTAEKLDSLQNPRISLHDIELYNQKEKKFCPVILKIGYSNFQVLHETPRSYKFNSKKEKIQVQLNEVFSLVDVTLVCASNETNTPNEFTVNFFDGSRLIFCSTKFLEIVKMFYYAESKIESEYYSLSLSDESTEKVKQIANKNEVVCHLCLVILVGLFSDDDDIKNISYNLLVATQNAFNLNFGTRFFHSSEVYVPDDTTTFLSLITKELSTTSPELTPYIWKYFIDGLENGIIPHNSVPIVVTCLSYWIPNVYQSFYLSNSDEYPETGSHIIQSLIKLTIQDSDFMSVYLQQIWFKIALDNRLTKVVVEEIINHALERDSENREWKKVITLLAGFPTIEVGGEIIKRFMQLMKTFLPALKFEPYAQSWSELMILTKLSVSLFFEAPLLSQMYLPEILFVISLLIDIGPSELRLTLHKLLMNVCHSLAINESLAEDDRQKLLEISTTFSRQKLNLIAGFCQDKGNTIPTFNSTSFTSKVSSLENFTTNIILLMEYSSRAEASFWKTKYKKYILDSIFSYKSFLSARAMLILGVMGRKQTSEFLYRDLLVETMKVFALPVINEEITFLTIAHTFSYARLVEGLDPKLLLLKELFWLSTALITSPHPVLFEGSLLFMTECLNKLYSVHFESNSNRTLPSVLIESRKFANEFLNEIEAATKNVWSEHNFSHIIVSYIIRGLSIPVIKGTSQKCLRSLFLNSYKEHRKNAQGDHHLVYLFLLFLQFTSEQFEEVLAEAGIEDTYVQLDNNHRIPHILADWLILDKDCPNFCLYQCGRLFGSSISDEPCKYRFALIVRYLLETNPICVYRFYIVIRKELRRISSLEHGSDSVLISFDIINLLVIHHEFEELMGFIRETEKKLEKRGLEMISKFDVFDINDISADSVFGKNSEFIFNRRRLIVMILARITTKVCY